MTKVICTACGEIHNGPFRLQDFTEEDRTCRCGGRRVPPSQLKPRKPLRRVSEKRAAEGCPRGLTLKRSNGFAASPAQRAKVRDLACIITGQDRHEAVIHPMHVWDRGRGGCDDPLCVVPGRADIHRLYDEHKLDILPALLTGGYFAEIAHVIEMHRVSLTTLLERVTGQRWAPLELPTNQPKEPAAPDRSSE